MPAHEQELIGCIREIIERILPAKSKPQAAAAAERIWKLLESNHLIDWTWLDPGGGNRGEKGIITPN